VIRMFNIGLDTFVMADKVKSIVKYDSAKIKKDVARIREENIPGTLIDGTKHKPIRTVVILDDNTHILSALTPDTLLKRLNDLAGGKDE